MSEVTLDLDTKNILDILNDDCIDEILRRLDNMEDILSTANVCKRLQMCAKQYYRIKYATEKDVAEINYSSKSDNRRRRRPLRYKRVQTDTNVVDMYSHTVQVNITVPFLKMFGSMIKNISFGGTFNNKEHDDEILKTIIENCKLKELWIDDYEANFEQIPEIPFELESLHVIWSLPTNFVFFSNFLKRLHISTLCLDEHTVWFMQKMPKLTCFSVKQGDELTDNMVFEFLSLNPQLKIIEFAECDCLTPLILNAIANCVNVVELHLCDLDFTPVPDVFKANIRHLSSLKNLKFLSIALVQTELFETLFDLMAENDIPIETMWITLYYGDDAILPACSNLRALNTLKHLVLDIYLDSMSYERVVGRVGRLVETQTALEEFTLNGYRMVISMETLARFLKYRNNLKIFKLKVGKLTGDLNGLEKALDYAAGRVHVKITVCHSDGNDIIPVKALGKNRKWIDIRYYGYPS